jgi:beta-lactamase regulating signal transducer with metallopeptidase domain
MDVLANWLWQGCAVAVAATILLHASPRTSATTRYRAWWIALLLVLSLPALPALFTFGAAQPIVLATPQSASRSLGVTLPMLPWWAVATATAVWIAWTALSLVRLTRAFAALRRAKAGCSPFPALRESRLRAWTSMRQSGRRATLVISPDVRSAAVLGLSAPAIAVAPAVVRALSDGELDQILVHEWAHVQRRDDKARVVQLLVTAVAGLHPAIWWIDRRLHIERETACDDWTVNITGAPKAYAACLTRLAAMGNDSELVPAVWSSSTLTTRVVRLLDRSRNTSTRVAVSGLLFTVAVLVGVALSAARIELVVSQSPSVTAESPPVVALAPDETSTTPALPPGQTPSDARPAQKSVDGSRAAPSPRTGSDTPTGSPAAPSSGSREIASPAVASSTPAAASAVPRSQVLDMSTLDVASTSSIEVLPGATGSLPVGTIVARGAEAGKTPTPWGAAADAGVAVGKSSQKAAVKTAGFFARMGKSIAGAF